MVEEVRGAHCACAGFFSGALCWRAGARWLGFAAFVVGADSSGNMPDLTSPEASIADAAAKACFEQLCTEGSAHGFELPAALKVRAAADLRDPTEIAAAKSLVALVVQTAHASTADDALLAGIAALASAVLSVDAALAALDVQAAKLRRRLLPVLEGCLLSASMLLVREQDGEVGGGPQPQDDLVELALEVALHSPSLEAAAHATSLLAACAREEGGALPLLGRWHMHCTPTARSLHAHCVRRCAPPPPTVGRPPRAPRAARPAPLRGGGGPGRRAR